MAKTKNGLFMFDENADAYESLKKLFANTADSNMKIIDDLISALQEGKATVMQKTAAIGTSWEGTSVPYSQTITVDGILQTDAPLVDIVPASSPETAKNEEKEWAKVYRIVTSTNAITVYVKEKTTIPLNIKLQVVR